MAQKYRFLKRGPQKSLLAILLFVVLLCSCSPTKKNVEANTEVFSALAGQRTSAEEHVIILKRNWSTDSIVYKKGREYYVDAEAAFNACIEKFKANLVTGDVEDLTPELRAAVGKSIKFTTFVNLAQSLENPADFNLKAFETNWSSDKFNTVAVIIDIAKGIVDMGIVIWREYKEAEDEKRDLIIQQLEDLKWRSFEDIR